jgi:MoaA/NifB/PqqE/SkfB family radical SAM enzyme
MFVDYSELKLHFSDVVCRIREFADTVPKCPHYVKILKIEEIKEETNVRNYKCYPHNNYFVNYTLVHNCNSDSIVKNSQETMTEKHLSDLADFFGAWGSDRPEGHPKSCYISGGGEPLMNPSTPSFIERLSQKGIQSAVITNGTFLNDSNTLAILKNCRWVGISVDATCNKTYNLMKGLPEKSTVFDMVIEKMKKLVRQKEATGSACDIGFKFLLHPHNYKEIYAAAELARSLGVNDFHLRPVRYINFDKIDADTIDFKGNLNFINEQFEKVQTLNTNSFHVYGIRHKFNPDLSIKKSFSKCRAIPLEPTFSSDGQIHVCFDQRGRESLVLCNHYPEVSEIAGVWNSEKHKEMIRKIVVEECPACTFSSLNEAIEKAVIRDNMCINFV